MAVDYTPLELRRNLALESALRMAGLLGGDTSPIDFLTRTAANTVMPTYRVSATAQQKSQASALIAGWDWTQVADDAANPPAAVPMSRVTGLADAIAAAQQMASAAQSAANAALAASLPYYATTVTTGSNGTFTVTLPQSLFGVGVTPVVLATVQPTANQSRPHTCNLTGITPATPTSGAVVAGYVSYIRPLPTNTLGILVAALAAVLSGYDVSQAATGAVVHLRAGFPKTS